MSDKPLSLPVKPVDSVAPGTAPTPHNQVPRSRQPARAWSVGALLFVCILCGYLLSVNVDQPAHNGDWFLRYQVACRIVEHNRFTIVPYQADARSGPGLGGATHTQYTLGQTTALIPLYLLGRALAGLAHTACTDPAPAPVLLTCKLLGPLLGALLCVLFFALARLLGYARPLALALTLLLAFATSLWPDVQSNLEHTLESLLLLVAAYAAVRYTLQRRKEPLWVSVMGLAAGLEFVTRVSGIIVPPIFLLYLLVLHRRWRPGAWRPAFRDDAVTFALWLLPALGVNAAFNLLRFGSPLRTGPYPDASLGFPLLQGLPDLLLSPGKGLLWYSPAVLLLVLAARPFGRRFPLPARLFALIGGGYLLFYANVTYWHGDPAWGPRYLYATLPYLILPLGEVWRRWRAYPRPVRGVVVGVLACSFLVQFAAVSVSYWRWEHGMFAYHIDQAAHYDWGWNLNYYWRPDQSPLVSALGGVGEVAQHYVDGAPTVRHWYADQRYGSGNEACTFRVWGQATVCLTDADDLRLRENWNTFTVWWLHDYPWWGRATVAFLAVLLLALFLASGTALLALIAPPRVRATSPPTPRRSSASGRWMERVRTTYAGNNGRHGHGHGRNRGHRLGPAGGFGGSLPPYTYTSAYRRPPRQGGDLPHVLGLDARSLHAVVTPLMPLGRAAGLAALVLGGIAATAALRAPEHAPPVVQRAAMRQTVVDGDLAYSVLSATELSEAPRLPGARMPRGQHYLIVLLRLRNLATLPLSWRLRAFAVTDEAGHMYPMAGGLNAPAALLYHVPYFWWPIPARGAVEVVEAYQAPTAARHLDLLGPGITLIPLRVTSPPAYAPAPMPTPTRPLTPTRHPNPVQPKIQPRPRNPCAIHARRAIIVIWALHLRRQPSLDAEIVETLPQGTILRVEDSCQPGEATTSVPRGWLAVLTPRGWRGYVFDRFVRPLTSDE